MAVFSDGTSARVFSSQELLKQGNFAADPAITWPEQP